MMLHPAREASWWLCNCAKRDDVIANEVVCLAHARSQQLKASALLQQHMVMAGPADSAVPAALTKT
jgi:hypothetical protein